MRLISKQREKSLLDWGLSFLTLRASKLVGRHQYSRLLSPVDWDREEYEAYKALYEDVWMYVCVNLISSNGGMLPCGTFKRQPKTKGSEYIFQEDHWLTNLLEDPNPWMTGSELIEGTLASLEISGKAFWEKAMIENERPNELYLLDPRQVRIKPSPKKFIDKYIVTVDGNEVSFEPEEIVYFRYNNPTDCYNGLSPSTPAGTSIKQNIAANKYGWMFFRNGGMPIGAMSTDRRLAQADYDRMQSNWTKSVKSIKNWFNLLILEGGTKYQQIQNSPRDLALKDLKLMLRDETLASYGIPKEWFDTANYASTKERQKMFWRNTMMWKLQMMAKRMTKDLLSKDERQGGKFKTMFDLSGVEALQEDQEIKSRIAFNLQKSLTMVPDEIRKFLYKMQPHANGFGSHLFLPSNMVTAEALVANGGKPLQGGGNGQSGKPGGPDADSSDEGKKPGANDGKPAKEFTMKDIEELRRLWELESSEPETKELVEIPEFNQTILVG